MKSYLKKKKQKTIYIENLKCTKFVNVLSKKFMKEFT